MGHVTRHMFKRCKQTRCQRNIYFCFCFIIFYYILLKTVPYRFDPFQMDIAYWIRTERFTEPNRTKPLKKTGVDIRLKVKEVKGVVISG